MREAAICWGSQFERVANGRRGSRRLPVDGMLVAHDALEEVALRSAHGVSLTQRTANIRAYWVRGESLSFAGLRPGDYLLTDSMRGLERDSLVLARIAGRYTLERASSLRARHVECEVLGAFIGIIRRVGFNSRRCAAGATVSDTGMTLRRPSRLGILRSQLDMLETTRATTSNPRLRRALRQEAERVRKQLQIGAIVN